MATVKAPVVLVHGNPETSAIWGPLLKALGIADAVCVSPPGFGAPIPTGFGCTMLEYRDWLIDQLQDLGQPVHLVGHDWGGAHVVNVAMTRPDLLSSWASDTLGIFHPDYTWHELAQLWQTPGEGETSIAAMLGGTATERISRMTGQGITAPVAEQLADAQGEQMGRAVLALYRSATQPALSQAGRNLPAAAVRPGLGILASDDHFVGTHQQRHDAAQRAGAHIHFLDGLGHWWMVQDPQQGARMLQEFWDAPHP